MDIHFFYIIKQKLHKWISFYKHTVTPSTKAECNNSAVKPLVIYSNCELEKNRIFVDNNNKAVVYRWVNNINNKTYVGSSINLSVRLHKYYSVKHLTKHKTPIHNALLKYGFANFTLEILEYCGEGINPVVREQYYLDLLKPEYNVLEQAGSSLGFKHSEETLEFFYFFFFLLKKKNIFFLF